VFAYINGDEILSADITPGGWNSIALTYDSTVPTNNIKLYVDGVKTQKDFQQIITTNENALIIGGLKSIIDEVIIYNKV
jgi:hypothetical protein